LACSKVKRSQPGPLPALERYDGPLFRVLRKPLPNPAEPPTVFILSARHGLLGSSEPIPWYDERITENTANALRPRIRAQWAAQIKNVKFTSLLVGVGKDYELALTDVWLTLPADVKIERLTGSIGRQAARLRDWLSGQDGAITMRQKERIAGTGVPSLCGVSVRLTAAQVLDAARLLAVRSPRLADRFERWYILVDDKRISAKQVVSHLTALPVSRFRTADAVRLLNQLGIDVSRTSG
jgi:hypothetical protein